MKTLQPAAPVRAPQSVRQPKAGLSALQLAADQSATTSSLASLQRMANARAPVQRMEEEEMLQGKLVQRVEEEELQMKPIQRMEEDELQGKFIQRAEAPAPKANNTGLPDTLKSGIENLSGMSMDHVQVHRNSDKPAAVQAHAYAQGSNIHLGPGQEKHLPHEAWHVVQQAQGRVKPTMQLKGVAVNDDAALESEADVMGAKALQMNAQEQEVQLKIYAGTMVQRVSQDGIANSTINVLGSALAHGYSRGGLISIITSRCGEVVEGRNYMLLGYGFETGDHRNGHLGYECRANRGAGYTITIFHAHGGQVDPSPRTPGY
jgi:hypothetical protein